MPHPRYNTSHRQRITENRALGAELREMLVVPTDDVPAAATHCRSQLESTAPPLSLPPTSEAYAQPTLSDAEPCIQRTLAYNDHHACHHTVNASHCATSAANSANDVIIGTWPPPLSQPPLWPSPTFSAAPPQPATLWPCSKHVRNFDEETAPASVCAAAHPHPPPEPPRAAPAADPLKVQTQTLELWPPPTFSSAPPPILSSVPPPTTSIAPPPTTSTAPRQGGAPRRAAAAASKLAKSEITVMVERQTELLEQMLILLQQLVAKAHESDSCGGRTSCLPTAHEHASAGATTQT